MKRHKICWEGRKRCVTALTHASFRVGWGAHFAWKITRAEIDAISDVIALLFTSSVVGYTALIAGN